MSPKNLDNTAIAQRIRDARKQAKLTQEDLAKHLRRTSAAISDLERGKVQVSAVDLYKLAMLLKVPIEYFYGEDFGGDDVRGLIGALRAIPKELANIVVPGLQDSIEWQNINFQILVTDDEQELTRLAQEHYRHMGHTMRPSNPLTKQTIEAQRKLADRLNITYQVTGTATPISVKKTKPKQKGE